MIYEYRGIKPVVHPSSYVHPQANVTGHVVIGKDVYIGPFASLRGDFGKIVIEDGCNVQEGCTIHMFPGTTVTLHKNAHIGHGAIVHGASVGENCLIGMHAVLMDDAIIGKESIVGALAFVPAKKEIAPRSVVVGNPCKVVKEVTDEMLKWKTEGTELYQTLPKHYQETLIECEPLAKEPNFVPHLEQDYKIWKDTQK